MCFSKWLSNNLYEGKAFLVQSQVDLGSKKEYGL